MAKAANEYQPYMNEFFMKRAKSCVGTVVGKALCIKHYWDRVEFAPGKGGIHLHKQIGIARDRAYLCDFYRACTNEDKAAVLDNYAQVTICMTTDINGKDDALQKPDYQNYLRGRRYCECHDQEEDIRKLAACVTNVTNSSYNRTRQMLQRHAKYIRNRVGNQ